MHMLWILGLLTSCPNENVDAIRYWAQHFKSSSSTDSSFNIPIEWCNVFTLLLLSPTHFNWASTFLQSKAWDFFSSDKGNVLFSIPPKCPLDIQLSCNTTSPRQHLDKKGKAIIEDITPPSSPTKEDQGECSLKRSGKNLEEVIVDSSIRKSLIKRVKRGFKIDTCPHKNCLACDSEPPTISPSIIKNLGVTFCKIEEDKLTLEALKKKKIKTDSSWHQTKEGQNHRVACRTGWSSCSSKEENNKEDAVADAVPQHKKVEVKRDKSVKDANKKPKK